MATKRKRKRQTTVTITAHASGWARPRKAVVDASFIAPVIRNGEYLNQPAKNLLVGDYALHCYCPGSSKRKPGIGFTCNCIHELVPLSKVTKESEAPSE